MKTKLLICDRCGKEFLKPVFRINQRVSNKNYCSNSCYKPPKLEVSCIYCGKTFFKTQSQIEKTKNNNFCSSSCSCTYQNTHKISGYRRSKLEIFLEEKIREVYPDIELICNDKQTIESELDFYFPSLKFAIELNGIFHYEPIYGVDKFEKIQNNDKQKLIRCYEKGIELCILDTSSIRNLTVYQKQKWWDITSNILEKIKNRQ